MTATERPTQSTAQQAPDRAWEAQAQLDFAWVEAHREELSPYIGQWIAVTQAQLIAHDPDGAIVMRQARELGFGQALCLFLYPDHVAFA